MKNIIETTLGTIKSGARRLWLQGKALSKGGFEIGNNFVYHIDAKRKTVTIALAEDGSNTISRKKLKHGETPILDLRRHEFSEVFGDVDRVRVTIEDGVILVTLIPAESMKAERKASLKKKIARGDSIAIGDICHGGGILSNALAAGLKKSLGVDSHLAWAVEIDSEIMNVSLTNNELWAHDSLAISADANSLNYSELPDIDVLVASPPCVTYSAALRGSGRKVDNPELSTDSGSLFLAVIDAVKSLMPAAVVIENVTQYENSIALGVIENRLKAIGYKLDSAVVDESIAGSLERRSRLAVVATLEGIDIDLRALSPWRQKEACLGEIMEDVPTDSPLWLPNKKKYLAKEQRGQQDGSVFRCNLVNSTTPQIGCIPASYGKWQQTNPTIERDDDVMLRLLTPIEHARAKGIPERLIQGFSSTLLHRVLGNSVLYGAFASVGALLGESLGAFSGLNQVIEAKAA